MSTSGLLTVAVVASTALATGVGPAAATTTIVSAVSGSAYGYFTSVSFFGSPPQVSGPAPTVTLPSSGSTSPMTATASTANATFGPATFFTSDQLDVSAQGTLGAGGSATTSSTISNVNRATTQPTATGSEILTAGSVSSTCTADATGIRASATFAGPGAAGHASATLRTSEGDPNVAGDETYFDIPTNPAANTTQTGALEGVGDTYRVVFNEQIANPDGSLTVNAAHEYLLGPSAVGDVIVGQSICGVTLTTVNSADLSVAISDNPDPVAPAATVTYTVTVANAGPEAASGVTLSSTVAGAKLVSVTPAGAADTCTVGKGRTRGINCNLGSIAASGSDTVTIVAAAPHKTGSMSLTSTVSSTSTDTNSANNTATETTTIQKA